MTPCADILLPVPAHSLPGSHSSIAAMDMRFQSMHHRHRQSLQFRHLILEHAEMHFNCATAACTGKAQVGGAPGEEDETVEIDQPCSAGTYIALSSVSATATSCRSSSPFLASTPPSGAFHGFLGDHRVRRLLSLHRGKYVPCPVAARINLVFFLGVVKLPAFWCLALCHCEQGQTWIEEFPGVVYMQHSSHE